MANPHNNNFPQDNDDVRAYRLLLMQDNIDTYESELGISGPVLVFVIE